MCYSNKGLFWKEKVVGVFCDEGTPVPIPNTVVKLIYADNTWLATAREDRSMPTQTKDRSSLDLSFFLSLWKTGLFPEYMLYLKSSGEIFHGSIVIRASGNLYRSDYATRSDIEQLVFQLSIATIFNGGMINTASLSCTPDLTCPLFLWEMGMSSRIKLQVRSKRERQFSWHMRVELWMRRFTRIVGEHISEISQKLTALAAGIISDIIDLR